MEKYKEIFEKYSSCTDSKQRQKLWNIMFDILEQNQHQNGESIFYILGKWGLPFPSQKWFVCPKAKFKRKSQLPLKWFRGYMKPNNKLKLTKLILNLWQPKNKRVFFAIESDGAIILSDKKILKVPEEELKLYISKVYQSKASKKLNSRINKLTAKASIQTSTIITDTIAPIGKCRGEPKRLKKCWR